MSKTKSAFLDVRTFIDKYWDTVTFKPGQKMRGGFRNKIMKIGYISLPNPVVATNSQYFAGTQFYWDSYFTILGLINSGKANLAKGMVDNLCYLFSRFGYVPARNSWTSIGRTQPPFLTRMAWEVYESGAANDEWMQRVMTIAEAEYEHVWTGGRRLHKKSGLSRYRPRFLRRLLTVYESGWDRSSRFAHGKKILPVDLNALLFQYEQDLYDWAVLREQEKAPVWQERMQKRLEAMNRYFWDSETGFFYDYDLRKSKRPGLRTLAGFFPLWCGMASEEQSKSLAKQLPTFEHDFGLANTEKRAWKKRQWDYPNGWPPLQQIVLHGLRRYGFNAEAARITTKWLTLNEVLFQKTGRMWEKYDVVRGDVGKAARYPTQSGFSWTNGVFLWLLEELKK